MTSPDSHDPSDAGQGWGPQPQEAWTAAAPPAVSSAPPQGDVPIPRPSSSRTPIVVALFLVAILSGSALFASGFTLGLQQSLAPGTSASEQDLFDPFWEAYRKINTEYVGTYDPKTLVEGAIQGMFGALDDPYSSYMTSQEYHDSMAGISGEFEGIGATMAAQDAKGQTCAPLGPSCRLIVVGVLQDSPAEAAGITAGDRLTAVDDVTVDGTTVDDTVERVRGPRGTQVHLSMLRGDDPLELTITRDVIKTPTVTQRVLADGTVGYLRIDGFSGSAAEDLKSGLKTQLDGQIRRFVLDLRDDPGGFVDAALTVGSQFVGSGPIYWEEYADGLKQPVEAEPGGIATDPGIRLVVLVNGGSASASEILAGALHDSGRATLVGETTYGKGTIQQWHLLSGDSGGFRLSIAKWLTPNQTWIHGVGITPDVVVHVPLGMPAGQDPQLDRALEILAADPTPSVAPVASKGPSTAPSTVAMTDPGLPQVGLVRTVLALA